MVVRSVKNQYHGINAHLHSLWQAKGGWTEFHTRHIVHLADALKAVLLPMGYTAALEPSLQIRRIDLPSPPEYPESDVTLYDLDPLRPMQSFARSPMSSAGELVFPIIETLLRDPLSEKTYNAIALYEARAQRGEPVAWIELLSPSNKPGGRDVRGYFNKRIKIIESGIVFVELDYLHESAPTLSGLPDYRSKSQDVAEADVHPYRILIVDPRPNIMEGVVRVKGFDVDERLPALKIGLNANDMLGFDLTGAYHKTLEDALYGLEWVDYRLLPVNFDHYRERDQTRIVNRMLVVLEAAQSGIDLETSEFAPKNLPLETALAEIMRFQQLAQD
jgi:Protein of unknown function (DUF4058)